jgi:hypothetical protein
MTQLYSYKNQEPAPLPSRIRIDDGSTLTSLENLSREELISYGFTGPYNRPNIDKLTQKFEWNGHDYEVINLTEEEIENKKDKLFRNENEQKIDGIDYTYFWAQFLKTKFNYRLRNEILIDNKLLVIYNKLISLILSNLKSKEAVFELEKFFLLVNFTNEEILSLKTLIESLNVNLIFNLPDEDYISNYTYDYRTDSIIGVASPFSSWIWNGSGWEAPTLYPTDGKYYRWDEATTSWELI